jgi:hypothetical protein
MHGLVAGRNPTQFSCFIPRGRAIESKRVITLPVFAYRLCSDQIEQVVAVETAH